MVENNRKSIYIAVTFDTDNDPIPAGINPIEEDSLGWKGLDEGIPDILESIDHLEGLYGIDIQKTWFVRCDNQLREIHGDAGFLLKEYSYVWNNEVKMGNEIGMHLHLYRKSHHEWKLETRPDILKDLINDGCDTMNAYGYKPISARIGDSYMSNIIMRSLNDAGVQIDSTAMPGRRRIDNRFQIDWYNTPENPYFPSELDYRIPGKPSRDILEVPMSMIPTTVDYDKEPLKRYIDLGFNHHIIRESLRRYLEHNSLLVTITHPFEIATSLMGHYGKHPLISYDIVDFQKNLNFIISTCQKMGINYHFIRLSHFLEMRDLWTNMREGAI